MKTPLWPSMRRLALAVAVGLLLAPATWAAWTGHCVRVVDGDTIKVRTSRLIGVNTPETVHPNKPVEYFGREASAFTKRMAEGQVVRLAVRNLRGDA